MSMERAAHSSACDAAYACRLSLQVVCVLGDLAPTRLASLGRCQAGKQADLHALDGLDGRGVVAAEAEYAEIKAQALATLELEHATSAGSVCDRA